MLKNIWASGGISMRTKLCIFNYMADNTDNATKDSDIFQHLSEAQRLQNLMAEEDLNWRYVGVSWTGTSGQPDTVGEVGLDRTHPQEASIQHNIPSPDLEPAGEERPASQQLEMRHWSRAKTTRDKLDWKGLSSPEQCAMVRGRRWLMLHREW